MSLVYTVTSEATEATAEHTELDVRPTNAATDESSLAQRATRRSASSKQSETNAESRIEGHIIPNNGTTPRTSNDVPEQSAEDPVSAEKKLSATAIASIMAPLCLSKTTLSALDVTITTPAIPAIVSAFDSVQGYVWIGSAFVLTNTASTPIWGTVADI